MRNLPQYVDSAIRSEHRQRGGRNQSQETAARGQSGSRGNSREAGRLPRRGVLEAALPIGRAFCLFAAGRRPAGEQVVAKQATGRRSEGNAGPNLNQLVKRSTGGNYVWHLIHFCRSRHPTSTANPLTPSLRSQSKFCPSAWASATPRP